MSGTADANKGANRAARLASSAASDNATAAINGPCQARGVIGYNNRASAVYLKLYQLASTLAAPVSTDTPALTFYLPASAAFAIDIPGGFDFNFGMGYRMTTGVADGDTGAVASGDIVALNILVA